MSASRILRGASIVGALFLLATIVLYLRPRSAGLVWRLEQITVAGLTQNDTAGQEQVAAAAGGASRPTGTRSGNPPPDCKCEDKECPLAGGAADCPPCEAAAAGEKCEQQPAQECPPVPECPPASCPPTAPAQQTECSPCAAAPQAAEGDGEAGTKAAAPAKQAAATAAAGSSEGRGGGRPSGPSWRDSPFVAATDYQPGLTAVQLQKGLVSLGAMSRPRRALAKLLRGEPLSVAFIGGSITWGQGAAEISRTDYAARVMQWLRATFPKANHTLVNGGIPGVPSSYFALCSSWHVPANVDLVVVESNINDWGGPNSPVRRAHERLLRKLLRYDNRPAVLELVFFRYPGPNWILDEAQTKRGSFYRYHGDDEVAVLAQYYHTAWLGTRSLVWDYLQETAIDPASRDSRMQQMWGRHEEGLDPDHPGETGHGWLADMIIYWMQQVMDDVARRPPDEVDEADAQAALSVPMYLGNWESVNNTCLMGDLLKRQVTKADPAFNWVNEGSAKKPKWGYVSTQPGSSLWATLSTNVTHRLTPGGQVSLAVAFLKSYEHMGVFEATCESGCACEPLQRDGHSQEQFSQMHHAHMLVSASEACTLRFTVLNQTSSGEHKFKLLGLVVSEVAGMMVNDSGEDQPMSVQYSQPLWNDEEKGAKFGVESDEEDRTWRRRRLRAER